MQSPALLDAFPYGIDLLSWYVSLSLPRTLAPAQIPIGAVQGPSGAAARGFAAASPFLLETPAIQSGACLLIHRHVPTMPESIAPKYTRGLREFGIGTDGEGI
jgi:hypothetical protein